MTRKTLIITCEHGGYEVPPAYAPLFAGREALLETHRGWDPGALEMARQMAGAFEAPLFFSTTTRLLVDLNRSIGHKNLHSEATQALPPEAMREIIDKHYQPHRSPIEAEVARRIGMGEPVLHIASHSFTPELHGIVRPDVAFLYDTRRPGERSFASRWLDALKKRRPDLKLRRNYPYNGREDGLTALLRRRYPPELYVGMELEINQRYVFEGGRAWDALRADVIASLGDAMDQRVA